MAQNAYDSAGAGDLASLKTQLAAPVEDLSTSRLICVAATAGHVQVVQWIIEERFPDCTSDLQSHLAALQGGVGVYEVFLKKWPNLIDMELGHNGNPIGFAIIGNDKAMVELLLSKGVDPNTADFSHRPLNKNPEIFKAFGVSEGITSLLVNHGFESSVAAQKSNEGKVESLSSSGVKESRCIMS